MYQVGKVNFNGLDANVFRHYIPMLHSRSRWTIKHELAILLETGTIRVVCNARVYS